MDTAESDDPGHWRIYSTQTGLIAIFIVLLTVILRITYMEQTILNIDEGISAMAAVAILDGGLPYVSSVDHRGPLTYYLYALAFLASDAFDMSMVRLLFALLAGATTAFVFLIGNQLRGPRAGLISALFFAIFSWTGSAGDYWAAHTEWPLALFSSIGALCFLRFLTSKSRRDLILSGLAFGIGALSKQVGLFDCVAVSVFIGLAFLFRKIGFRRCLDWGVTLWAAFFTPILITLLYFLVNGHIGDFVFYTWTYNTTFYMAEVSHLQRLQVAPYSLIFFFWERVPLLFLFLPSFFYAARSLESSLVDRSRSLPDSLGFIVLWNALTLVGAFWSGRGFQHYFIQALPSIAVLSGTFAAQMFPTRFTAGLYPLRSTITASVLSLFIFLSVAHPARLTFEKHRSILMQDSVTVPELPNYLSRVTDPEDTIFVWGASADIYVQSGRRQASRFPFCNALTGQIFWTNTHPSINTDYAIVPGSREIAMRELTAARPLYIIDTSPSNALGFSKYPLAIFPELLEFVTSDYELDPFYPGNGDPRASKLYRRKANLLSKSP